MNPLPSGWSRRALVELQAKKKWALNGGPFGSKLVQRDYVNSGVPVIRGINLSGNAKFNDNDFVYVSERKADELRANNAEPGDVIFTQRGTLGQVGLIPEQSSFPRYIISQSQMKMTVDESQVLPEWIYYYFTAPLTVTELTNKAFSCGVPHINLGILRELQVPVPPLPTQRKIAAILSAYDDLIENNLRRIKILEEMAQNLYREWFVKFRFPGHQHARFTDSPLGRIPEGWEVKGLGELAVNFDRLRKPLSSLQRAERKGIYPYYGAAKIFDYIDAYIFDGIYLLVAEDGSVVTADRKPVLQYVGGKFWANNHTHILQGKGSVSTEFLYMVLSEIDITGYITGAAQPKITQANLNRIPVVVAEDSILQSFNEFIRDVFRQKVVLGEKNKALRCTRDLLLPRLISGEVDVSALNIAVPEEASV